MKKVFALLMVAGVVALASCGKKEEAAETTAPAADTTVAAPADTTAAPAVDTTAAAAPADTAAAAAPAAH